MLGDLVITALYTAFFQNLVLSFAFGASEAVRVSLKPRSLMIFAAMISGFSVVTSAVCYPLERFTPVGSFPDSLRVPVYAAVLAVTYFAAAFIFKKVLRASSQIMTNLGIAAVNTLVLAVPFVNRRAAYSFAACIGSGIGAGAAFVLAAVLISKGVGKLSQNEDIPRVFKGTPALFLYVSLISLAFACFAGNTVFA